MKTFLKFLCIVFILTIADKCKAQVYFYGQDTVKVIMIAVDTSIYPRSHISWISDHQITGVYCIKGYTISYKKAAFPPIQNQNGKDVIVGEAWATYIRYFHEDFTELNSNWLVFQIIKR